MFDKHGDKIFDLPDDDDHAAVKAAKLAKSSVGMVGAMTFGSAAALATMPVAYVGARLSGKDSEEAAETAGNAGQLAVLGTFKATQVLLSPVKSIRKLFD